MAMLTYSSRPRQLGEEVYEVQQGQYPTPGDEQLHESTQLRDGVLERIPEEHDLDVLMDNKLTVSEQYAIMAKKANGNPGVPLKKNGQQIEEGVPPSSVSG